MDHLIEKIAATTERGQIFGWIWTINADDFINDADL
jgi:hypothetical protein